jgi:hypothetical protein
MSPPGHRAAGAAAAWQPSGGELLYSGGAEFPERWSGICWVRPVTEDVDMNANPRWDSGADIFWTGLALRREVRSGWYSEV